VAKASHLVACGERNIQKKGVLGNSEGSGSQEAEGEYTKEDLEELFREPEWKP
jgi:hypothetical protein